MTITLGWWAIPAALCIFGILAAVVSSYMDRNSGGYGSIGQGCFGAVICFVCFVAAAGICLGRWLS